jgi:hypothetical protein
MHPQTPVYFFPLVDIKIMGYLAQPDILDSQHTIFDGLRIYLSSFGFPLHIPMFTASFRLVGSFTSSLHTKAAYSSQNSHANIAECDGTWYRRQ